jgi:hypothetical protein
MTTTSLAVRGYTTAALVALAAAIVVATAIREPRPTGADLEAHRATVAPLDEAWPAWFAPIAASYPGTAGITPLFDYASLYGAPALDSRGDVVPRGPVWPWNRSASTSMFSTSSMEAKK